MKPTIKKLLPALLLLSFTLGCSVFNQLKKQAEADKKTQVITSTDNKSQLTVPASWDAKLNVNNEATIQTGKIIDGQYAVVITESKKDFAAGVTLEEFTVAVKENTKANVLLQNIVTSEAKPVTINGYPAMQFEANGTAANIKINWIYTMVDAPKNYHQVLTWSLASNYEKNKPLLLEVTNSFKEIDASVDPAPPPSRKKK